MHPETINSKTKSVLAKIAKFDFMSDKDFAAMKIDTISARGSKKDFVDIYFLLEKYSLSELISFFEQKYANIQYNKLHILKSLSYFADADSDPDPLMMADFDWEKIKSSLEDESKKLAVG